MACWLVAGMITTYRRFQAWQTDRTLWAAAVQHAPTVRALVNYGNALARDGAFVAAREMYTAGDRLAQRDQQVVIHALIQENLRRVEMWQGAAPDNPLVLLAIGTGCPNGLLSGQGVGC